LFEGKVILKPSLSSVATRGATAKKAARNRFGKKKNGMLTMGMGYGCKRMRRLARGRVFSKTRKRSSLAAEITAMGERNFFFSNHRHHRFVTKATVVAIRRDGCAPRKISRIGTPRKESKIRGHLGSAVMRFFGDSENRWRWRERRSI